MASLSHSHWLDNFVKTQQQKKHPGRLELALSIALLWILAIVYCAWPIWRMTFPLEIDGNEPWNAWHAHASFKGLALYPDPQGLVANNYPPLSFYLVGALSSGSFDAIYVGRALSVMAIMVTCIAVTACIRLLGGTRISSIVGAVWLLATLARFYTLYFGMNDPHLPALAIMVSALAWVLLCVKRSGAVEPAIALMVLAGFYKHSLVATPIAALVWIAIKDWRRGLRAAIFGVLLATAGLTLCVAIYGPFFIQQVITPSFPREYSIGVGIVGLSELDWIALAVTVWAIWIWYDRNSEPARFTLLYLTAAFVPYVLGKFASGVESGDSELLVAIAIGVGMVISQLSMIPLAHRWGSDRSRALIITSLALRLVVSRTYLKIV